MNLRIDLTARDLSTGQGRRLGQPLLKAVGIHKGDSYRPRVLDATAGLGRDAMQLTTFGCRVIALERHPRVYAALRDALEHAGHPFQLVHGDFLSLALTLAEVDVVYLDPMYALHRSAKPKLAMQQLAAIVGDDPDQSALLAQARKLALRRVVVKRHHLASPLAGVKPSLIFRGRSLRYDVYLAAELTDEPDPQPPVE